MKKALLYLAVVLAVCAGTANAQQTSCTKLTSDNGTFTVCAPEGWVLDSAVLRGQGVDAALYPDYLTFAEAEARGTIMYINMAHKAKNAPPLSDVIASDGELLMQKIPRAEIVPVDSIAGASGMITVREYKPGEFNRYEAVAYTDTRNMVAMCVMSAVGAQEFKDNYAAFAEMVGSFQMEDEQKLADVPAAATVETAALSVGGR